MNNINCGIGVLHVKRQILTYLFVTLFLCSLEFLLFQLIGHTKRCLPKNIENVLCLSFCDMTVPSKSNVILTFDLCVSCINFRSIYLLIAEK